MPVLFEDWIKNPLSIINNLYENDAQNFDAQVEEFFKSKLLSEKDYSLIPCINEVPIHNLSPNSLVRFRCMIQDSFDPVYYTSVHRLKHKTTGEIRYMTAKYKETFEIPNDYEIYEDTVSRPGEKNPEHENLQQRTTFYCVPVPGEAEWVKNMYKSKSCFMCGEMNDLNIREKRPIENLELMETNQEKQVQVPTQDVTIVCQEKNVNYTICKVCYKSQKPGSSEESKTVTYEKKTKTEEVTENNVNIHVNLQNNFPLAKNETGKACLVKTYDDADKYKINDLIEFVGVLIQDPSLAYQRDEHRTDTLEVEHDKKTQEFKIHKEKTVEDENHHLCKCSEMDISITKVTEYSKKYILSEYPPSLVPRIHCITSFNLLSNNPLLKGDQKLIQNEKTETEKNDAKKSNFWNMEYNDLLRDLLRENNIINQNIDDSQLFDQAQIYLNKLRNEIILMFQEMLLGDALAAEYLLMYLLSSVFMRKDVTVLGKFCLNISNIPSAKENGKAFSDCFYSAFNKLVTMSHMFKLSIDNMNISNLIPNKDYSKEKLISGMLQLPELFHLVIDETVLNAGELKQKGLINLNALKEIVNWQKLNYDFGFHQQEFNTNLRLLILSETKSILTNDVHLKLNHELAKFDSESYEKVLNEFINESKSNLLNYIRKYLSILTHLDYKLSNSMQQLVENDIVQIRQTPLVKNKDKMSFEDFHLLLVVARLQTISYGKTELGIAEWNRAKSLEMERLRNRLN
ncbi:unnamed protein product [Brachionus calyciflorus]|uniref:Mini-chromosome maintenance complex-binding protein n=1 Tax=Brachionus calyciflorus TaxID=104777 RepID=A0A813UE29_9BILA|nr:unnamed protein product [Brachionus calyciflorus]